MSSLSGISSGATSNLLSSLQSPSSSTSAALPSAAPPITVGGLASGLNTNQIIQSLLAVQEAQVAQFQSNQQQLAAQETAFKTVEAQLLTLQGSLNSLAASFNGAFDGRTVASSNSNAVTAAASSGVTPGVYSLQVIGLAQAQEIASQGFADPNSTITQGTLQFKVGSGPTTTITINNTNNTLRGLADAINNANGGVTATVINDGTSGQPNRLLLTANQSGAANTISITNNLAASNGNAVQPTFAVGNAVLGAGYSGTSTPTSTGTFTGASGNTYTFTVANGGTVGTDNGIQLSYTDATGAHTGTITLNAADAGIAKSVAQGIQVQLGAGTLVAGQTFTITGTPPVQQAADASVTLGSGSGALTVQSPSNTLNNLINGVTVNLLAPTNGQPVTLTIAADTSGASKAVQGFVQAYNDLASSISQQQTYDAETGTAGPLLGNSDLEQIQSQLADILNSAVPGANPLLNNLTALGITLSDQGQLTLDQSKLTSALSGQVPGVGVNDVRNLFALAGNSSNPGVQFITGTDKTKAPGTPYQVNVTQAATQASVTATNPLAAATTITSSNNTFSLTLDGTPSSTITLAPGTYTPQALAQEVQGEINASKSLLGRQVVVSLNGSQLNITSNSYGSSSQVKIGSGTAIGPQGPLGFAGGEAGIGQDVAGNFLVNGVSESAHGSGQFLTGLSTNTNTSGLLVRVTLNSSQLGGGPVADLTITRGFASQLNAALQNVLDPVNGRLKLITDNFDRETKDVQKQIDEQNNLIQLQHDSLVQEFTDMETTISQLQTAGGFLSGLASSLPTATGSGSTTTSGSSA
jgi:flagellar hook-associated protein 2